MRELKRIVDKTDAKLVLISSWKNDYEDYMRNGYVNYVGKYLYDKLRQLGLSIYDTTAKYANKADACRGYEIHR